MVLRVITQANSLVKIVPQMGGQMVWFEDIKGAADDILKFSDYTRVNWVSIMVSSAAGQRLSINAADATISNTTQNEVILAGPATGTISGIALVNMGTVLR